MCIHTCVHRFISFDHSTFFEISDNLGFEIDGRNKCWLLLCHQFNNMFWYRASFVHSLVHDNNNNIFLASTLSRIINF